MKLQFHAVAQALVVLLSLAAGAVCAQAYPVKPVRVVIPWPPGGGNDIAGRIVMQKLAENLGQQIVIDNRAGASGTIGSEFVAKAAPDGYTLMVHSTTHVGNPHLFKKLAYDTLRDFAPVALLTAQPTALTVHPSLPVKSVKEFIALAKSRPNDIIYSTAGNGSAPHLSMALFESMTGIRMVHVPYKGGGPQVIALLAGESQASLAVVASVINHIKAGKLRPLGVSSLQRSTALPDVPPIAEAGVPGYEMSPWIAAFAPAATPKPVIDRLNAEINKVLKMPDVARSLSAQGLDPWPATPEEFGARMKTDHDKYGRLIRMTGARID
jgi:tripartite-type tricarboxylate transporter receptor subunit TctC